jgi:hypothetical protein
VTKAKAVILDVGSFLIIDHVKALREQFDNLIRTRSELQITSSQISEVDLTGIQLIQYFLMQAEVLGKALSIRLAFSEEQKNILIKSGFTALVEKMDK